MKVKCLWDDFCDLEVGKVYEVSEKDFVTVTLDEEIAQWYINVDGEPYLISRFAIVVEV